MPLVCTFNHYSTLLTTNLHFRQLNYKQSERGTNESVEVIFETSSWVKISCECTWQWVVSLLPSTRSPLYWQRPQSLNLCHIKCHVVESVLPCHHVADWEAQGTSSSNSWTQARRTSLWRTFSQAQAWCRSKCGSEAWGVKGIKLREAKLPARGATTWDPRNTGHVTRPTLE